MCKKTFTDSIILINFPLCEISFHELVGAYCSPRLYIVFGAIATFSILKVAIIKFDIWGKSLD